VIPVAVVSHVDRRGTRHRITGQAHVRHISEDDGTLGCDRNHLNVWRGHADNPIHDWSVVLEDDAIPVNGFRDQLAAALAVAPAPIVSLYLGTGRPLGGWQPRIKQTILQVRRNRANWILSRHLLHCVGVAIRSNLVPSLVDALPELLERLPIDEAITAWAQQNGTLIAYSWPSLVDHADEDTLVDHPDGKPRDRARVAWHTGTRLNWDSHHVHMAPPDEMPV
jgi:hypothetical protein